MQPVRLLLAAILTVVALTTLGACSDRLITAPEQPAARPTAPAILDETPPDTTQHCGGQLGSSGRC
jgi:hypothetical protein